MKTAPKKIIDIHAHAISFDRDNTGCFLSKKMMNSISFRVISRFFNIKRGDSASVMDEKTNRATKSLLSTLTDIDGVVFVVFDGIYDKNGGFDEQNTHFYITNDYVKSLSDKFEKVLFGASVNPNRRDALDELERVIKAGAVLIKWLPNTHGIDPADKRYSEFYKTLAKNRLPLLVHTGNEYALNVVDQGFGDFRKLKLPLRQGVTVIAAHGGGLAIENAKYCYDELRGYLKDFPDFYIDTSALFLINKRRFLYKFARDKELHHKIIYGSDWPIPSNPYILMKNASILDVIRSRFEKNFIQRNYQLTKRLNFSDKIFYTGYDLIKKDSEFESV